MEEVVFSVKLLVLIAQSAASFSELIDCLLHLVSLESAKHCRGRSWALKTSLCAVHVVALQRQKLVLQLIVFFHGLAQLELLVSELVLEPLHLLNGLLLRKGCLLKLPLHVLLLKRSLVVHRDFVELHAKLHDKLVLSHCLVLNLSQLLVTITQLCLQVLQLDLELVVHSLDLFVLAAMLLRKSGHVRLELLDQVLLVAELLLHHLKLLFVLPHRGVIFCRYLQFDILLLKRLDLLVQVIELGLVFLYLFLVLGDPLLVLGLKLELVLLQLLNLLFPLVVTLGFQELNLGLQLLNDIVLLLQLHVDHTLRVEVAALVPVDSRDQVSRDVPSRSDGAAKRRVLAVRAVSPTLASDLVKLVDVVGLAVIGLRLAHCLGSGRA